MRQLIRVFWGPRPEPIESVTERWRRTVEELAALLPAASRSWGRVHPDPPETKIIPDAAGLLAALRAVQQAPDWWEELGTGLRLLGTGAPGWEVEVSGLAGGSAEFVLQSLVVALQSPGDEAPADLGGRLLTRLALIWEPDFGDATDDDILDALEDAGFSIGDPFIGRSGYLSPGRAALVPDALGARIEPLPDGGVVLHVAAADDQAVVVAANEQLRRAGALEPLPRPLARPRL
ncbi:Imm52 family immunity protein [Microlunatus speluncae]|uniref:Imm52 family immunity protein n=1 Tax=Microlunatus speluncae TaxID=2594267 RepID=UPI0012666258|nr:Imm52 family immunity protein [Microlunatus speluncae]